MNPNPSSEVRSIPHHNLSVLEPQENGLAFLEQMEIEDGTSREAIRLSADNQYVPEKRLQNQNDLISRN